MMEQSIRCFEYSLWGFFPILGMAMATAAIAVYLNIKSSAGKHWNPAANYLRWGLILSIWGFLQSLVLFIAILEEIAG